MHATSATLSPGKDVSARRHGYVSSSREPWLRIAFATTPPEGEWIELIFESDLVGAPARPLLRAIGTGGENNWILPAPILGRGVWRGRTPKNVERWLISPVNREGAFNFRIVGVRALSPLRRLALCNRWQSTLLGLSLMLFGPRQDADTHFRRRLMGVRLQNSQLWRRQRRRVADWDGFDRLDPSGVPAKVRFAPVLDDDRRVAECLEGLGERDFLALVRPGDEWRPETERFVGAAMRDEPVDIVYGDEEIGEAATPWLKPDFDPLLARSLDLTGRARLFSIPFLRTEAAHLTVSALSEWTPRSDLRVRHLPRILIRTQTVARRPLGVVARPAGPAPAVTIIIPTRDRADLLAKCLDERFHRTAPIGGIPLEREGHHISTR